MRDDDSFSCPGVLPGALGLQGMVHRARPTRVGHRARDLPARPLALQRLPNQAPRGGGGGRRLGQLLARRRSARHWSSIVVVAPRPRVAVRLRRQRLLFVLQRRRRRLCLHVGRVARRWRVRWRLLRWWRLWLRWAVGEA